VLYKQISDGQRRTLYVPDSDISKNPDEESPLSGMTKMELGVFGRRVLGSKYIEFGAVELLSVAIALRAGHHIFQPTSGQWSVLNISELPFSIRAEED